MKDHFLCESMVIINKFMGLFSWNTYTLSTKSTALKMLHFKILFWITNTPKKWNLVNSSGLNFCGLLWKFPFEKKTKKTQKSRTPAPYIMRNLPPPFSTKNQRTAAFPKGLLQTYQHISAVGISAVHSNPFPVSSFSFYLSILVGMSGQEWMDVCICQSCLCNLGPHKGHRRAAMWGPLSG